MPEVRSGCSGERLHESLSGMFVVQARGRFSGRQSGGLRRDDGTGACGSEKQGVHYYPQMPKVRHRKAEQSG